MKYTLLSVCGIVCVTGALYFFLSQDAPLPNEASLAVPDDPAMLPPMLPEQSLGTPKRETPEVVTYDEPLGALPEAQPEAQPLPSTAHEGESAPGEPLAKEDIQKYPSHTVFTTIFWVGEEATADNGYIHNIASAWDGAWMESFGGVDSPSSRCGYVPCSFVPKENPFYIALPYNDHTDSGNRKENAVRIPWYVPEIGGTFLKNRWVKVTYKETACYGQWQDVGPFETNDIEYVFGNSAPKNTWGLKAGLDVSPAIATCLGLTTNDTTTWSFIDESDVPEGPWTEIITTSGISH